MWLNLLYVLLGICNALFIFNLCCFKLHKYKFILNDNYFRDLGCDFSPIGITTVLSAFVILIEFMVGVFTNIDGGTPFSNNIYFIISNIVCFSLLTIYLVYLIFFSFRGKYARKYIKIQQMKKKIEEICATFNNYHAVSLLNKSLDKLNNELEALLINETIKDAKNIEISFRKDILTRELDELNALQELNSKKV